MSEITAYAPGTFCWPELATGDPAGAKAFYSGLFGWASHDSQAGPDMVYTMLRLRDLDVGALYKEAAGPPRWNSYISVESADASALKAKELGGKIHAGPFDVMDAGRMAIVEDPTGGVFCLWQAGANIGAKLKGEPNTFCWNELATRDVPAAQAFYQGLFGWTVKGSPEYVELANAGVEQGGLMAMQPGMENVPPHWLVYFMVDDCNAAAEKAKGLGGTFIVPPMDIPNVGRFAVIRDPQGAVFAIITLANHPK